MGDRFFLGEVKNVPPKTNKYRVARYDPDTLSLWYWGSWDEKYKAQIAAEEVTGLVLERID